VKSASEMQQGSAEILRARAKALAQEAGSKSQLKPSLEVIEFRLAHERYALEATFVQEVYPLEDLTPVPCTPAFVRGLVTVRGRILVVIDLKKFFELPEQGITDLHRIIFIQNGDMEVGILVDLIVGIRRIPLDAMQPSLPTLTGIRAEYLKGVTSERLIILDAGRILADRKIIVHEDVNL
jgi:purine-binding chemotaxis protein CheW